MPTVLRGSLAAVWLLIAAALPARAEPLNEIWRGLAAYQAEDYTLALDHFNAAFVSKSLSYQHRQLVSYNRGLTRFRLGDFAGAIEDFNRTLKLNARHPRAFAGRGAAFAATGEFYRALQDYNRALKFDPDFALGYFYRANVHSRLGNQKDAIGDFERALTLEPDLKAARRGLDQLGSLTPQ